MVIDGNEIADELARQVSLQPCVGYEPTFGISAQVASEVKGRLRASLEDPLLREWENDSV
jgi:hypothetical protein